MSRLRTLAHVGLTAVAIVLAVSWAASAVPLQSARPSLDAKIAISDEVKAPAGPKLVHQVKPAYPEDAKKEGVQGLYVIAIVIGEDGAIKEAHVAASAATKERLEQLKTKDGRFAGTEGDARLAAAALDAVKQWRYEPILVGGKPADLNATVTVNFKLD